MNDHQSTSIQDQFMASQMTTVSWAAHKSTYNYPNHHLQNGVQLASPLHQNCQAHPSAPMAMLLTAMAKSSPCFSRVLPPAPPASSMCLSPSFAPNLPCKPP
ncbi:hypothetical protein M0R45_006050 [Rubus argutus]|uniref:Uncharacterized protein n=1 Tax=Rubus argutus TaxID=59490 RepID=A0AAW1YPA4_RUBAR